VKKKFDKQRFCWQGVPPQTYTDGHADGAGRSWRDTSRHIIKGRDEGGRFDVRYFEVGPGGFTSLERHTHIHSVICVRGRGYAVVGEEVCDIEPFDHVYVPPDTAHQFVSEGGEPFGFLCIVDSERDRPRALSEGELAQLRRNPKLASKLRQ
jgi:mannose-6-phosphate isomerase-like protein (cupin superfamily)